MKKMTIIMGLMLISSTTFASSGKIEALKAALKDKKIAGALAAAESVASLYSIVIGVSDGYGPIRFSFTKGTAAGCYVSATMMSDNNDGNFQVVSSENACN